MSDRPSDAAWLKLGVEPGACSACKHAKLNETQRGTAYLRCTRAEWDSALARYPRLPVTECAGFERRLPPQSTTPASCRITSAPLRGGFDVVEHRVQGLAAGLAARLGRAVLDVQGRCRGRGGTVDLTGLGTRLEELAQETRLSRRCATPAEYVLPSATSPDSRDNTSKMPLPAVPARGPQEAVMDGPRQPSWSGPSVRLRVLPEPGMVRLSKTVFSPQ